MTRLAVFDVDGTLVDSRRSIAEAMAMAFTALNLPAPTYEETRKIVGLSLIPAIKVLAPDLPESRYGALGEAYKDAFIANREKGLSEPLYIGAREIVVALKDEGWRLGIATGKARRGVDKFLDTHAMRDLFECAFCADDGPGKPHPHMLQLNMRALDMHEAHTVMIGDTSFDMTMARAAQAYAQGVSWGFHTVDEIAAGGAHDVAHDFTALKAALDAFRLREAAS
jgi:phosphoglycolate phosphatase